MPSRLEYYYQGQKMKVIQETCIAGRTIDRTIKITSGNHRSKRSPKINITPEKVQKNNDRIAAKKLMRLLNANFAGGDLHIVLTYKDAPDQMQAKKDRENFLKALRRKLKKNGKDLKYIAVTEYKHTRIHHHIVIGDCDIALIEETWKKGFVKYSVLDNAGNYADLAAYLIKETTKTIREEGSVQKKRYSRSANLITPIVTKRYVDESKLWEDPEPIKGYYIDQDHCRRYEHPVTGLEHLEYIMVAIDEPRKIKRWPGQKISGSEYYKTTYEEEQESLWI